MYVRNNSNIKTKVMTREEAKNMAAIMQAYADGKTIQFLGLDKKWIDIKNPSFRTRSSYYRVKPE